MYFVNETIVHLRVIELFKKRNMVQQRSMNLIDTIIYNKLSSLC